MIDRVGSDLPALPISHPIWLALDLDKTVAPIELIEIGEARVKTGRSGALLGQAGCDG